MKNYLSVTCLVIVSVLTTLVLLTPLHRATGDDLEWRRAAAHAKANSPVLVFVTLKEDGSISRESAYCGASTIANDRVLTAAHCVDNEARVESTWVYFQDGRKFKVKSMASFNIGLDLAVLNVPGVLPVGTVVISDDIATGDEIMGTGAPGGEMFKASWGRIDRIYTGQHDVCDGIRRPVPIGHKPHQVVETDRVSFFGYSGGGIWNGAGRLVGVHVRGSYWEPYPGYSCSESYRGEYLVFGAAVGGKTVIEFLNSKP